MANERRLRRRSSLSKGQKRLLKDSLREFLGYGLLDLKTEQTLGLFFLKDALNSRLLNPKDQKN